MQPVLLLCVVIAVIGTFTSGKHINTRIAFARSALGKTLIMSLSVSRNMID